MSIPQFGLAEPGRDYKDRPAAFGLALRNGQIALVLVKKEGHDAWVDLPGGAIDPGETAAQAVIREFGEETGLLVRPERELSQADQLFLNTDGAAYNNRCAFFVLALEGEDRDLKIEDDHTLVWMDPGQALQMLRHDAHAWAVATWLRLRP